MNRNLLPQNLIKTPATILDSCDDLTGLNNGSNSTSFILDTTNFLTSTGSWKITTLLGAGFNRFSKQVTFDLNQSSYIEFYVYPDSVFSSATLYLFTDATNTNYYTKNFLASDVVLNSWNRIRMHKSDFVIGGGTPDFNNKIVKIQMSIGGVAGANTTINIDNFTAGQKSLPKTVFTFDDGFKGVIDIAYPYMEARGIKGTVYVISNLVGTGNYMTLSDLTTLHNNGWIISNHTKTHQYLATLTKEQQRVEMQGCIDFLNNNGFSDGAQYIAFPYGSYNQNTLDLCPELGIKMARTTTNGINIAPMPNLLKLTNVPYETTISVANLKSNYVDKGLYQGGVNIPMMHNILTTPVNSYDMSTANFQAMIDYHVLKKTDNITIDRLYKQLSNIRL